MQPTEFIWFNGELVPWDQANVHVMSHALHYGSSVFEGLRCYDTPHGRAIFRLQDHIRRLFDSAKIYRIDIPFTPEQICRACHDIISHNGLSNAYIRPLVFFGVGTLGLNAIEKCKVETMVGAIQWGPYLGAEGLEKGIDACISSWNRSTSASIPVLAKAGGHYTNAQLIATEAHRNGYVEGISVNMHGMVSEGSGENVFTVRDEKIYTPPLSASILGGITRDTVIRIAESLGHSIIEQALPREMLYIADEVFLTGTAAEVTPIRSIDQIEIGKGCPGPITKSIQEVFFGLFDGSQPDQWNWLEMVEIPSNANQ